MRYLSKKASHEVFHLLTIKDLQLQPVQILDGRNEVQRIADLVDEIVTDREVEMRAWLRILIDSVKDCPSMLETFFIPTFECGVERALVLIQANGLGKRHLRVQIEHKDASVRIGRKRIRQAPSHSGLADSSFEVDRRNRFRTLVR